MVLDVTSLAAGLPEDILKKKWAGDISGALEAMDARLDQPLPAVLRSRLMLERVLLQRMVQEYPHTKEQAMAILRGLIPDFTEAEFDALERGNQLDFLYVEGEKRYFTRFHRTLLKVNPDIAKRAGVPLSPLSPLLDTAVREMKEKGALTYRFRIRATMKIAQSAFVPGETYLAHIPLPIRSAQTEGAEITACEPAPYFVSPQDHPQRTVCYLEKLTENKPFVLEYAYDCAMRYTDLSAPPVSDEHVYPLCPAPSPEDLGEVMPHICFTPYLKALAAEILCGETDPLKMARLIYDFVTTRVTYSFMRSYATLESHAEYGAINLKGDCGIQALLFITLCRIAGIPARWQSGLCAEPGSIGSHDWAQFYVKPWGWVFADCSFGGSAWRKGNMERWNFYFGNIDPYRMAANSAYQADFTPPKKHMRIDPYDNQGGECECSIRGLEGREIYTEYEMVSCEKIDRA